MAVELDGTNMEAWLGLADVYTRRMDYKKALEVLETGLDHNNGSAEQLESAMEGVSIRMDRFANQEDIEFIEFIEFADLDREAQAFLEEILAKPDDVESITSQLTTVYIDLVERTLIEPKFRTVMNGYKIQLVRTQLGDSGKYEGTIDIRPKEGTAYQYSGHGTYSIGTCKDWNWNGPYETTFISTMGSTHYSGNCTDCLLDGAIHITGFDGTGSYDYYEYGKETNKRIMDDGTEREKHISYGENDVHVYSGVMDINIYQSKYLW